MNDITHCGQFFHLKSITHSMFVLWNGKREFEDSTLSLDETLELLQQQRQTSERHVQGILCKWWKTKYASNTIPLRHIDFFRVTETLSSDDGQDGNGDENDGDDNVTMMDLNDPDPDSKSSIDAKYIQQLNHHRYFRECYCLILYTVDCQLGAVEIKLVLRPDNRTTSLARSTDDHHHSSPSVLSSSSSSNVTPGEAVFSWIPVEDAELSTIPKIKKLWSQIRKNVRFPVHLKSFSRVNLFLNHQSLRDVKCRPPYACYRHEQLLLEKRLKFYDFICQQVGHRDVELFLQLRANNSSGGCICLKRNEERCPNTTECLRSLGQKIHKYLLKEKTFGGGKEDVLWSDTGRDNDTKGFFWMMLLSLYDPSLYHLMVFCEVVFTLYKMVVFGWTESDQLKLLEVNNFSSSLRRRRPSSSSPTSKKSHPPSPFWCRLEDDSPSSSSSSGEGRKFEQVHKRYLSENSERIGDRQQPRWFLHVPVSLLPSFDLGNVTLDDDDSVVVDDQNTSPPMAVLDYTCTYSLVCSITLNFIKETVDKFQQKSLWKAVKNSNLIPSLSIEKKTSRGYSFAVGNHKKIRLGTIESISSSSMDRDGDNEDYHRHQSSLGGMRVYNLIVLRSLYLEEVNRVINEFYPMFEVYVVKPLLDNRISSSSSSSSMFHRGGSLSLPFASISKRLLAKVSTCGGDGISGKSSIAPGGRYGGSSLSAMGTIGAFPSGFEEFIEIINSGNNDVLSSLEDEDDGDDDGDDDDDGSKPMDLFPPCVARLVDRRDDHPKYKERFFVLSFLFDVGLPVPVIAVIFKALFKEKHFTSMSFVEFYRNTFYSYGNEFISTMKSLQKYKRESNYPFVGNGCCNLISNGLCPFSSPPPPSEKTTTTTAANISSSSLSSSMGDVGVADIEDLGRNYDCGGGSFSARPLSSSSLNFSSSIARRKQGVMNDCQKNSDKHKRCKMMCVLDATTKTGKRPRYLFRRPVDCYAHKDEIRRNREQEEIDYMKGN